MTLRPAAPRDAAAILEVIHRSFAEYEGRLVPPSGALRETPASIAGHLGRESCLLAECDGKAVGTLFFKAAADHYDIGRLAVVPECRGAGIARRLIASVEASARAAGIAAVALGVRIALPTNIAFFASLGYREVSRNTHEGFTEPTSLRMEKRLICETALDAAPSAPRIRDG